MVGADESRDEVELDADADADAEPVKKFAIVVLATERECRFIEAMPEPAAEVVAALPLCEAMCAGRAGTGGAEGATGMSKALRSDLILRCLLAICPCPLLDAPLLVFAGSPSPFCSASPAPSVARRARCAGGVQGL